MKERTHSKSLLHSRNKHAAPYDYSRLVQIEPELKSHIKQSKSNTTTIDFFNPTAIRALNRAILKLHYQINYWDFPAGYLCPPIPGRVDYIHYLADLLALENNGKIPIGGKITCLDIGTGANCIYPLLGNASYNWSFVGTEIDLKAVKSAEQIIKKNKLNQAIQIKKQSKGILLQHIIGKNDRFDLTLCNPPFHSSAAQAKKANLRKVSNLKKTIPQQAVLNFGGQHHELWCKGGEYAFVRQLIHESKSFASNCLWFSSLVSKKESLPHFLKALKEVKVTKQHVFEMKQGQKISRVICWTFLPQAKREIWRTLRWN